jgi:phage uncharacterized protein TIGR01671
MSRQYKFRAWDVNDQKMLYNIKELHLDIGKVLIEGDTWDWYKRERILMQYTGLHDRNGNEIYEGDVVNVFCNCDSEYGCSHAPKSYTVFWHEDGLFDLAADDIPNDFAKYMEDSYEVIGNIYEHPELLESRSDIESTESA